MTPRKRLEESPDNRLLFEMAIRSAWWPVKGQASLEQKWHLTHALRCARDGDTRGWGHLTLVSQVAIHADTPLKSFTEHGLMDPHAEEIKKLHPGFKKINTEELCLKITILSSKYKYSVTQDVIHSSKCKTPFFATVCSVKFITDLFQTRMCQTKSKSS